MSRPYLAKVIFCTACPVNYAHLGPYIYVEPDECVLWPQGTDKINF